MLLGFDSMLNITLVTIVVTLISMYDSIVGRIWQPCSSFLWHWGAGAWPWPDCWGGFLSNSSRSRSNHVTPFTRPHPPPPVPSRLLSLSCLLWPCMSATLAGSSHARQGFRGQSFTWLIALKVKLGRGRVTQTYPCVLMSQDLISNLG